MGYLNHLICSNYRPKDFFTLAWLNMKNYLATKSFVRELNRSVIQVSKGGGLARSYVTLRKTKSGHRRGGAMAPIGQTPTEGVPLLATMAAKVP